MDIEYLKHYKQLYIIGHNNPDADSIISSKILADILKESGINADYAILEKNLPLKLNNNLVKDCLDLKPIVISQDDTHKYKYFLVDHNDPIQSVNDVSLIVGGIDHHPNANKLASIVFLNHCATALAIYDIFKSSYDFNEEQKKQIFHAVLSDSCFGRNVRYKESDKALVRELGYSPNFDDYFKKYFIPTDFKNLDDAFRNTNLKSYGFNDIAFESTYMEAIDTKYLSEFKAFVNQKNHHLGMWLNYQNNKTYMYFKYDDLYLEKEYDFLASRANVISDEVLEFLRSNDKNV